MTQVEKHALIERVFFGREWTPSEDVERYGWLLDGKHPGGAEWDCRHEPPNYSGDLNLCARVEAKIAEMGVKTRSYYAARLEMRGDLGHHYKFRLLAASADARVDVMVALVRELEV